jgi:hypothetical protein
MMKVELKTKLIIAFFAVFTTSHSLQAFDFNRNNVNANMVMQQLNPAYTGINQNLEFTALAFYNSFNPYYPDNETKKYDLLFDYNTRYYNTSANRQKGLAMQYTVSKGYQYNQKIKIGVGVAYTRDLIEEGINWSQLNLNSAVHCQTQKGVLSFGLGILGKTGSSYTFDTYFDRYGNPLPDTVYNKERRSKFNFNIGISYESKDKNTNIGLSVYNVLRPIFKFVHTRRDIELLKTNQMHRTYVLNINKKFILNKSSKIKSNLFAFHSQNEAINVMLRTEFLYKKVGVGIHYSNGTNYFNYLGPLLSFESKTGLRIQYAFKLVPTRIISLTSGQHELGISYNLGKTR